MTLILYVKLIREKKIIISQHAVYIKDLNFDKSRNRVHDLIDNCTNQCSRLTF